MKRILAGVALAAMLATVAPKPALADGAASTRNIILGGAALYWLISANNQHQRAIRQRRSYAQQRRYNGYRHAYDYDDSRGYYDRHRYHRHHQRHDKRDRGEDRGD